MRSLADIRIVTLLQNKVFFMSFTEEKTAFWKFLFSLVNVIYVLLIHKSMHAYIYIKTNERALEKILG